MPVQNSVDLQRIAQSLTGRSLSPVDNSQDTRVASTLYGSPLTAVPQQSSAQRGAQLAYNAYMQQPPPGSITPRPTMGPPPQAPQGPMQRPQSPTVTSSASPGNPYASGPAGPRSPSLGMLQQGGYNPYNTSNAAQQFLQGGAYGRNMYQPQIQQPGANMPASMKNNPGFGAMFAPNGQFLGGQGGGIGANPYAETAGMVRGNALDSQQSADATKSLIADAQANGTYHAAPTGRAAPAAARRMGKVSNG